MKNPEKTSPRKHVPTGDRTRTRCVTSSHATTCPTAVDSCEIEREKLYPGPGSEPGPLALRASALPLRYPGQLPIQGRINLYVPILSDLKTTNSVVITSYRGMHSYT